MKSTRTNTKSTSITVPLTDSEIKKINRVLHERGLKKGAYVRLLILRDLGITQDSAEAENEQ